MTSLNNVVDRLTIEGELFEKQGDDSVRCTACGHRCLIRAGRRGVCQVRYNENGKLRVPWGYVAALQSDPIEKKPFFHVMPASHALTFGMLGCDYHCPGCQNWYTSQFGRDSNSNDASDLIRKTTPAQMVEYARRTNAKVVVSSYNEPLITSEWAVGIFKEAKTAGLMCAYVSNGNATPEVLEYLRPYLSAYKVDLKCMQDKSYRRLGGTLQNTLDTIKCAHEMGLWVEIVTLIIPGFNDSNEELWDAARFITSVSKDIPWHVTAFHKDYKMTAPDNTDAQTLLRAADIGREAGLHYVYAGNATGRVGEYENTFCSNCSQRLITRRGYVITEYKITGSGTCPKCHTKVAGLWSADPSTAGLNGIGTPRLVY